MKKPVKLIKAMGTASLFLLASCMILCSQNWSLFICFSAMVCLLSITTNATGAGKKIQFAMRNAFVRFRHQEYAYPGEFILSWNHEFRFADFTKKKTTSQAAIRAFIFLFIFSLAIPGYSQLGAYRFTGPSACPHPNVSVAAQPANAVFSNFRNQGGSCDSQQDIFNVADWNIGNTIDLSEYNEFSITANSGFLLDLASITFSHQATDNNNTKWCIRSSIDNFSSEIALGTAEKNLRNETVTLPVGNFSCLSQVTFRFYIVGSKSSGTKWMMDDVALNGRVKVNVATPATPVITSSLCQNPGVTLSFNGAPPASDNWYWQSSASGTSTANANQNFLSTTPGTFYLRAQNISTGDWSCYASSITVAALTPDVSIPVFTAGASSQRCVQAATINYAASAANSTSVSYSLDSASLAAGNTIDTATGDVTFDAAWSGTSTITCTAQGCSGPVSSTHVVTTQLPVTTPVFTAGDSTTRCQGGGSVSFAAIADHTSGITYTLDAASIAGGNTINAATGEVTFAASWFGTTTVTATAAGCFGPLSETHIITTIASVGQPVFASGDSSGRCVGAETIIYSATATTNTAIAYSLDSASFAGGNIIDSITGEIVFNPTWVGTSTVTAIATGCNGPTVANQIVITHAPVAVPVFAAGDSSQRCQGANNIKYAATATNAFSIIYSLDAASLSAGNTIDSVTAEVTYAGGFTGTSIITATAIGCNGPTASIHAINTIPTVGAPVFVLGDSSSRCQGAGTATYSASSTTTTGITYGLDAASLTAGNTINITTGEVTFVDSFSGASIVSASAAGCNGPAVSTHTVNVLATVGTPIFSLGNSSSRCQGTATVAYTATATTNTGITYALDSTSIAAGNAIDVGTGEVTFAASWFGTSTITATATGCNGPSTSTHTVTTNQPVSVPIFVLGDTSERCQGAGVVAYTVTADHTTGITYSLDAAGLAGGNTIDAATGAVTYAAGWSGTSIVTASAAGCGGPQTASHTITTIPTVGVPVFAAGNTSSRCQAAEMITYTASATNSTGITYALDATSLAAGNSIDTATGAVSFNASWFGTSVITATATGCNGPVSTSHTITTNAPVTVPVFASGDSSVRCQGATVVFYTATADNTTNITYNIDAISIAGGITINSSTGRLSYPAGWSGTTTVTANAAGCYGPQTQVHIVTTTPTVGVPVFTAGNSSTRCQGAESIVYNASATNSTAITYSLNGASRTAGNTINAATGEVTFVAGYAGTSIIPASAAGCNGPRTATHTVTVVATVGTPVFSASTTSTRCQGSGTVTYTATATTNTGIVYTLDSLSLAGGNTINAATGAVIYVSNWTGTSIITATASGCNGPSINTHTATTTPTVGTPVFTLGDSSERCRGAGSISYEATSTNSTSISYELDFWSRFYGNTINTLTGVVTYVATWNGTSTITATAQGCNGPVSAVHTVVVSNYVTTPVFDDGSTSSRCQAAGTITYSATADHTTGITYTLDAASIAGGNTINSLTGAVTYDANWFGTTVITASAAGCSGPRTATHTVTINAPVTVPVFVMGTTSVRCQGNNAVIYTASADHDVNLTYSLDGASLAAGNTINTSTGRVVYTAGWTGTSIITARATGCYGPQTQTHTVTITPTVGTPVFASGSSSTRCQGGGTVAYNASATNNTGITYSLNAASITGGNTIDANTGDVTYAASWSGTTIITATAAGCNGPRTANHTVTVTPTVGTPVFASGSTSTRCQAAGTVTYSASSTNNTGLIYELDAASLAGGNTINASTGAVTYTAAWTGTSVISVTASGCNGPSATVIHSVTITPIVGTPVFAGGTSSVRCQGAGSVTYTASATDATGITYSLDAASLSGGNTINASSGVVTYVAGWTGTSVITARATGCSGPRSSTHTVTITPTVGVPVFATGSSSSRCQAVATVVYNASATNATNIIYSLDATNLAAGNTIDGATGAVTFASDWYGTTIITATAVGCNGPRTAIHSVITSAPVTTPAFVLNASSTRCQGAGTITYTATAQHTTGITYSLDAGSIAGGLTINTATGAVTYTAGWTGTATITASAAGCYGPRASIHTVITTPTVGVPVFAIGLTSSRCQGAESLTYAASSTNSTGMLYTLDGASLAAGNSIDNSTGVVTFHPNWSGNSTITATATGCNGPRSSSHVVTTYAPVTTPVFALGASSGRCQGAATVVYSATAANASAITYTLDASSLAAGNTMNSTTGALTYTAGWSGTSMVTATASGCYGPFTATHIITITPSVGTPFFTLGPTSSRCNGAGTVTYTATATTNTGITYSLDASSIAAGNSINASTGTVTYVNGWVGISTITARATGCNGPVTSIHRATSTPSVATPAFTGGATSSRCQGAGTVTYVATAANSTAIVFSLDETSLENGNIIDAATGKVTYAAGWVGTTTILATATGCNGPTTSTHTVTVNPNGTPSFVLGPNSTRVQGAASVSFNAIANNGGVVSYSLDAASLAAGNTINATTGVVTFHPMWIGFSQVTATANGCNGPVSAVHTVMSASSTVTKQLYLTDPSQGLDRIDPVASNDLTTANTSSLAVNGSSISVDNSSSATGTGSSIIFSHTNNAGADRLLMVGVSYLNGSSSTIQYVTYGGALMTQVGTVRESSNRAVAMYSLINPPVGTANVEVVFDLPSSGIVVGATTFNGVHQVTPLSNFASQSGSSSNPSLDVSSASNEVVFSVAGANNTITAVSGTPKWNLTQGGLYGSASSQPGASTANVSYVVGGGAALRSWVMAGVSIRPSLGATATFTQVPELCSPLIIKANQLTVKTYINILSGTMPASPSITAVVRYGSTNVVSLNNPVYNSAENSLTWMQNPVADVTVPAGESLSLDITSAQAGVAFTVLYDSRDKPSRIDLPVSTYIDINSLAVYDAPYPAGTVSTAAVLGSTRYVRATVSDPFGHYDITGLSLAISPTGGTVTATPVFASGCIKVYEYMWRPSSGANYNLVATATEGLENSVTSTRSVNYSFCANCPPIAVNDSASGAGGSPVIVDVLSNDSDPNNNINPNSIVIVSQPQNGNAVVSGGKVVYLPNGTFAGTDQFTYRVCDLTSPTPLCSTATVTVSIDPTIVDPCSEASKSHVYYIPFPEEDTRTALVRSTGPPGYIPIPSNNIRTIISLKILYPNMLIAWDHWEDGYENDLTNPVQPSTKVWGDGNPYNGIAPGYPNDIIPPGGSIVLDNTMPAFPRVAANIFYDGRDKIYSSGQITLTQVSGEPSIIGLQCVKTNVSAIDDFGRSFTIPVGEDYPSQDFRYTALFIRAAENNTILNIDKDRNGTFETIDTLNEGESLLVDGGVLTGATVTSDKPVGVDLHFGGVDGYSSREVPVYPATWYSNVYYSPVPTTGASTTIKDTAAVLLYNNLNRPISINWSSGIPASGTINLPAKTVVRFPLRLSATAGYKFVNPTGESFTAIQVVDSYTPGGGGNSGSTFDWAFNLISEDRLTTFAAIAWAPGSTDGSRNDNPIWVTPSANTTIYVKYDGDVLNGGNVSPCGLRYDVSYTLDALRHIRLRDTDNDQSGLAVYTCDGTKLAAVYGADPSTAPTGAPGWDVGSTIRPYCASKLVIATDDNAYTLTDRPVTIQILNNDGGFTAVVDPSTVSTSLNYLRPPKNGTVSVNPNGTLLYTPNTGFVGYDTLEYSVCSYPSPVVCDVATIVVLVNACPTPANKNIISGRVFLDMNKDGVYNDNNAGVAGAKVYLYADGNCNSLGEANELKDSMIVDGSGSYQFIAYPENTVADNFDHNAVSSCASGSDGTRPWASDWVDAGDPSSGYCVSPAQTYTNTNAEIVRDNTVGTYALRIKNPSVSATRTANLAGANAAFISFSYRKAAALTAGKSVTVQVSSNGTTFATVFTIAGTGQRDNSYVDVFNQDISAYANATTYIRILTSPNMTNSDTVFIDNVSITYLKYPICYITKVDQSSIHPDYYFSTASQNPMVATNGGTCMFPFDYGLAKKYVPISGTVYNDVNGIMDNLVNGIPTGAPSGNTMYAYLVDSTGKTAYKTTVNSLSGAYSFPIADINTNFSIVISTIDSPLYTIPPATANLPERWANVGEDYGLLNLAGTGIEADASNGRIQVKTGLFEVTKVDFGIELLPVAGRGQQLVPNPGGINAYTLPNNTFTNTAPTNDIAPGTVVMIRITAFPANVDVMTVNGVQYDRFTFPAGGLMVPVNSAGIPLQVITLDPEDGYVRTVLPYYAMDNAGMQSSLPGEAVIMFTVDTDKDGIPDTDDIDDDNDGITDFVENCGAGATTFSCLPNGTDPSGDDDNDGLINYRDPNWSPVNAAGCATILDADVDGIPDYLDLDSDNDGIPDVVEAYGVDANGDGIIDNFCDTDGDGLSQNVDANNTGKAGSGQGLGAPDFDNDGISNTLDLDADNDGVPDIVESFGVDANNDGRADNTLDNDGDGWVNDFDGDANGDGIVENLAGVLVLTGNDPAYINCASPGSGRPSCYTMRGNIDNHGLPNFIDLDSDGDGVTDAIESGIIVANYNRGMVAGCPLVSGWCATVTALPSLALANSDSHGKPDMFDIDSDNDGITDNVEAQPTNSYVIPVDADNDGDGLVNVYDFYNGIGGNGLTPYDHDADGTPDYRDTDTDNDGAPDRNEGDKKNAGLTQVTISASADTDGDGLVNYFDTYDFSTQFCASVYQNVSMNNMGAFGSYNGPLPGGSRVALVKSAASAPDRDWRNTTTLPLLVISFNGKLVDNKANLVWKVENEQQVDKYIIERSNDGVNFDPVAIRLSGNSGSATYTYTDDVSSYDYPVVYYRIMQVNNNGQYFYTRVILFNLVREIKLAPSVYPNPVMDMLTVSIPSLSRQQTTVIISDASGKTVMVKKVELEKGENKMVMDGVERLSKGLYLIQIRTADISTNIKIIKQ